jgi:hypothetical protein
MIQSERRGLAMTNDTAVITRDSNFRELQRQIWTSGTDVLRALKDRGDQVALPELGAARQTILDILERQEASVRTLLASIPFQSLDDEAVGIAARAQVTRWARLHQAFWEQWFRGMEALRIAGPPAAGLSESDLVGALETLQDAAEN